MISATTFSSPSVSRLSRFGSGAEFMRSFPVVNRAPQTRRRLQEACRLADFAKLLTSARTCGSRARRPVVEEFRVGEVDEPPSQTSSLGGWLGWGRRFVPHLGLP